MQDFLDRILFVIVIYRLPVYQSPAFKSLESELALLNGKGTLMIYDNSPASQEAQSSVYLKTNYQHNPLNQGVAAAYNAANDFALGEKKKWLMLLDQDTILPPGTLYQYYMAQLESQQHTIYAPTIKDDRGILSPFRFIYGRGVRIESVPAGKFSMGKLKVINSGLLIPTESFKKNGGYNENLILDFCDVEFLDRYQTVGQIILVDAALFQNFSGSAPQSANEALKRFTVFCHDAKVAGELMRNKSLFWVQSLLRALRLSLRHHSLAFLRTHIETW